jgi:hypothetical protein
VGRFHAGTHARNVQRSSISTRTLDKDSVCAAPESGRFEKLHTASVPPNLALKLECERVLGRGGGGDEKSVSAPGNIEAAYVERESVHRALADSIFGMPHEMPRADWTDSQI